MMGLGRAAARAALLVLGMLPLGPWGCWDLSYDIDPSRCNAAVTIAKGAFDMGSTLSDTCSFYDEVRRHVKLTRSFSMMITEVTRWQFLDVMGYDPGPPCNPERASTACSAEPASQTNWYEAAGFCNALSRQEGLAPCYREVRSGSICKGHEDCPGFTAGKEACFMSDRSCRRYETAPDFAGAAGQKTIYDCPGYRLPTEAEWEHAYRAGGSSPYYQSASSTGEITAGHCHVNYPASSIGWYDDNSGGQVQPVGPCNEDTREPNKNGLFDMAGNVFEWVHDHYTYDPKTAFQEQVDPVQTLASSYEWIVRGGGVRSRANELRAAYRAGYFNGTRYFATGFRCVRTISDP